MQASNINGANLNGFQVPESLAIRPRQPTSRKVLLSIVPLTPAPITGPDAWIGWARLAAYGSLAAVTFKRSKALSFGLMAATGVSLMSSMAGEAYAPIQNGVQ